MRRALLLMAAAALLVGPTVLAFFSGGYFEAPRLVATIVVWLVVLSVAFLAPRPFPRSAPGIAAVGGLALIAEWSGLSIAWAPLGGPAADSFVRVLMYLGALVAAAALLRPGLALKAVEPFLALGSLVVIGYGLAGRLLPGLIELTRSKKAGERLEQPITYWNAEGLVAAMGLVLCIRLAGSPSRPRWLRVAAAGACAPLGLGLYLSYSRGAFAALAVGVVVLLAVAPTRAQARAAALGAVAALVAAGGCTLFDRIAGLEGPQSVREKQGLAVLAILLLTVIGGMAVQFLRENGRPDGLTPVRLARRLPAVAMAAVGICLVGLVLGGLRERVSADDLAASRGDAARLASFQSRRYDYWRVGFAEWRDHPLRGYGASSFRVAWLRERPVREQALEVHSLPLEMAVELGLVGLLGFAALVGGVGVAARRAARSGSPLAAGLVAGTTVWLLHATIDWDWQLPAVTLPAILMAGALVAISEDVSGGNMARSVLG